MDYENEEGTPLKGEPDHHSRGRPHRRAQLLLYGAVWGGSPGQRPGGRHVYGAVGGTGGLLKEKLLDFGSVMPEGESWSGCPPPPPPPCGTSRGALEAEDTPAWRISWRRSTSATC